MGGATHHRLNWGWVLDTKYWGQDQLRACKYKTASQQTISAQYLKTQSSSVADLEGNPGVNRNTHLGYKQY